MKPWLYRLGAYVLYPLLAASGGLLLAQATRPGKLAAAGALLLAALALPAVLGMYCRRCGERPGPRLLRLLLMPAAIFAALAWRSATGSGQLTALALFGLSAASFSIAFRLTRQEGRPRQY